MASPFHIPKPKSPKTCPDCGQEYQGSEDDTCCLICSFYRDNPELAPKYWTWTKGPIDSWNAVCTWPEKEALPEPGLQITVHRKNGNTSKEIIDTVRNPWFDRAANLKIIVTVR